MNPVPILTDNAHHLPRQYPDIEGNSWLSYPELCSLMSQLPLIGNFIEIGTASGVSASVIAKNLPGLSIYCIDNFQYVDTASKDAHGVTPEERSGSWHQNCLQNMSLHIGTFQEFLSGETFRLQLRGQPLHILVDGDHEYGPVKEDLLNCLTIPSSPVIYAHDYDDPHWVGVKPAVDEFCEESGYQIVRRCNSLVTLQRTLP
jgi:hypothetical protein